MVASHAPASPLSGHFSCFPFSPRPPDHSHPSPSQSLRCVKLPSSWCSPGAGGSTHICTPQAGQIKRRGHSSGMEGAKSELAASQAWHGELPDPMSLHYRGKEVERSWTPSDTPGCDPVVGKWPGRSWPPPKSHRWTQAAPLAPSGASWTGMLRPSGPFGEQMEDTLDQQRHSIPRGCRIGPTQLRAHWACPREGG